MLASLFLSTRSGPTEGGLCVLEDFPYVCGPQGPDLHLSSSSKQTTLLKQGLDIPCMNISSESSPVDHHVEVPLI